MLKGRRAMLLGIVCAVLAEVTALPLVAQSRQSEKNIGSHTQASETLRHNDTARARAAIAKCPFVRYSGDQLLNAWQFFGGFNGNTRNAGSALGYLLSVEKEQAQRAFAANGKQRPSKQRARLAQNPGQQRERKEQGELFQKKVEEILPMVVGAVGTNAKAQQWPNLYQPGDPQAAMLTGRLQDEFQSVSGDRHPKTAEALAKKIEMENTEAAFYTAVAVAEWVATCSAKHNGPFELHTLLE